MTEYSNINNLDNNNNLLKHYLQKHFTNDKIKQLIEEFTFSELRKLLGELDIEFFALCYFPKYFDRQFGKFHRELFAELEYAKNFKDKLEIIRKANLDVIIIYPKDFIKRSVEDIFSFFTVKM